MIGNGKPRPGAPDPTQGEVDVPVDDLDNTVIPDGKPKSTSDKPKATVKKPGAKR